MKLSLTRRELVATAVAVGLASVGPEVIIRPMDAESWIIWPEGLEIRDYRLFPTSEVMRFVVEIFNSTDNAIDTPTLGLVLPHLDADRNFGWATPLMEVLHPHSSAGLIGVAPSDLRSDDDWGSPEWIACDETSILKAQSISEWDLEFSHSLEFSANNDVLIRVTVTNHSGPLPSALTIMGLVRDNVGRICGATLPLYLGGVEPGTTEVLSMRMGPTTDYFANPFTLLHTSEEMSIDFSIQQRPTGVQPGCAPVMPWNR